MKMPAEIQDSAQLLAVMCTEGSRAELLYFVRRDGQFVREGRGDAFIGRCGLGKECEGDGKTPEGHFRALRAFGILPDPGTSLPYRRLTPATIACDREGPYYNTIVETAPDGPQCEGERMMDMDPEYLYGIETDFNSECIYPLGSAIFIHCKGRKEWTEGCVAVDMELMKHILQTADSGFVILIHGKDWKGWRGIEKVFGISLAI